MLLPPELITLFGSGLLGGFLKIWARAQDARREERLLHLHALNQHAKVVDQARRYDNRGFQWTRRIIALTATACVIALPKLAALFFPETAVHYGYPQLDQGFLFFTADAEKIHWVTHKGLIITPLDTHLLSAIIGLYFGGSLAAHK